MADMPHKLTDQMRSAPHRCFFIIAISSCFVKNFFTGLLTGSGVDICGA